MSSDDRIVSRGIEEEMRTAYIDYSMSVIVSRALPDVRDGLKPVHRRVLYGMTELGLGASRPYKKSARIVGEVLGKYHPHGDTAVYDTMVRMAQWWSLRYPLVDGQGNFGSLDGDSPAAMRYTEARLRRISEELLADIDKNTVDFRPNFDDSLTEPSVLPAKVPNLLLNGASGIAVGMATNMPPHNLAECVDGIVAYIDNREITIEELMVFIKAPDFPTGGIIYGYDGVKNAFETGRGRVVIRAKTFFETTSTGREQIIISEIPFQVNKASLHQKIADLVNEKKIEGIADARDESDREGVRLVIDLKRDAVPDIVRNNLFRLTPMQTSFGVNNVCLVKGRPMTLNLKDMIRYYVDHRHEVVIRRTQFELEEAEKRAHILEGLLIALDHLDEVIALIRNSKSPDDARDGLMSEFNLTEIQAKAILDMRLQRLTGLERDKIREEYDQIMAKILDMKDILAREERRMDIIKTELQEMKAKYGDERRSEIVYGVAGDRMEDYIPNEEVIITISHTGYIKRTKLSEYKRQNRGGKGMKGAGTKDEDFVEHLFSATTHNYMLFFTEKGLCYWMKVYAIPEGTRASKGRAIQNLIQIDKDDKVKAFINVENLEDDQLLDNTSIIMCTRKGVVKKTSLRAYSRPRSNGIIAININEGDDLIEAKLVTPTDHVVIAIRSGRAIRFQEDQVRSMGRNSTGVRGVRLRDENDEVVGMVVVPDEEATLLVVSEKGYGKRSGIADYRTTSRGGKGVKTINISDKTGALIAIKHVLDTDDLMIITKRGIMIRMSVGDVREAGRATMGVRLIRLSEGDEIASVAKVGETDDEDEMGEDGEMDGAENTASGSGNVEEAGNSEED
ncbi:MAG: DNA gyrase subunit A [Bacteroidia bacterium]|nr:DNA gyrase subunit A [Bacteroidia bacterium]